MKQLALLILFSTQVIAGEVDSFSVNPNLPFSDSTNELNEEFNNSLQKVVDKLNKRKRTCEKNFPYFKSQIRKVLQNDYVKFLHKSDKVERREIDFFDSVYNNGLIPPVFVVNIVSKVFYDQMSPTIRVGDHYIGIDKLEHFLRLGSILYKDRYEKNNDLDYVYGVSTLTENTVFGAIGTGIKSYADHSSNIHGMRFYAHIFGENEDVLGEDQKISPSITCKDSVWVLAKKFDWSTYVDASWDERKNCSVLTGNSHRKGTIEAIKKLEKDFNAKLMCPVIDQEEQQKLEEKYKTLETKVLNFDF